MEVGWTLAAAALAILFAARGAGWLPRRSAIAFMIASWGARRAIVVFYTHAAGGKRTAASRRSAASYALAAAAAALCAAPALAASLNPEEGFTITELVAAGVWVVAFAAEAADRPHLRHARWVTLTASSVFGYASIPALWH